MISVTLIGDTASTEFAPLVHWLCGEHPSVAANSFANILAWESVSGAQQKHPLTLVFQSFSDQFAPKEVDRLIGATLFSGLLCCFGAWCEGDGRTRRIWPDSVRVPVRYAKQVIQDELRRMQSGHCPLPPTAARDEIFLHRQPGDSDERAHGKGSALVISTDRVYRSTFAQVLDGDGWNATAAGLDLNGLRYVRRPRLLVHDLDPQSPAVNRSLHSCLRRFPHADIFGLASMPQRLETFEGHEFPIVAKLDPRRAVQWIESVRTAAATRR